VQIDAGENYVVQGGTLTIVSSNAHELAEREAIDRRENTCRDIPWTMLEACFARLDTADGYNGSFFRERYGAQAKEHPCHVHVVGQIFVTTGIAFFDERKNTFYALHTPDTNG
jgi:hypothetical protein